MKQTKGLNPFLPFSTYIADGEPKVFGERLYLYGSYDLFGGGYCSRQYHVLSAPLSAPGDWTDHGVSFTVDDVPWSDALLYAPDALFYNGNYYLFFCLSDGTEGVAESKSPTGPFQNARQITWNGEPVTGIDPSVLADGDRIYYTWGQFHLCMAELDADLCTLKPETVHTDVLSNAPGREGFHEGSSLRKLGDWYCLLYASEYTDAAPNSGAKPTKLDYAVSREPFGPYARRGTVIDNDGCDPASWNNHGSVIDVGGQWFVFYHASTNNTAFSRRARVEKLTADEESGTFRQAVPTTNGFVDTLLPEHLTSPVHACRFFGGAYVTETPDGHFPCVGLSCGAGFAFSPALFRQGAWTLRLRYRADGNARVGILLNGKEAAEAVLPPSPDWRDAAVRFAADDGPAALAIRILQADNPCAIDALALQNN